MVPPVGIIITVTVLVAAGVAAYENPQVRAWVDRTRRKIATGLHSLGDEIHSSPSRPRRPSANDASMNEDKSELADERRRQAIAEIMERGRIIEERRKRRRTSSKDQTPTASFDNIVDANGILLHDRENCGTEPAARSSAIDPQTHTIGMKQRQIPQQTAEVSTGLHQTASRSHAQAQLTPPPIDEDDTDPFESRYEQEMREAWKIPVSARRLDIPSSHASESLIDLTPTTEEAPDPDFSVPSAEDLRRPMDRSGYFPSLAANSAYTSWDHDWQPPVPGNSHADQPTTTSGRPLSNDAASALSASSLAGSMSSIHRSEVEELSDDLLSEAGDGIRTPASVWTEVDSTVSGDFNL
ncbi:hypothetical protein A1O1_06887 [Capronia coronata CBS 617.96]|uniref:Uncharacterized protein n=1 Tax=Capronia coronata CBS 617.96 TaxID=1182541 RepID=W9XSQ6_9EURO|nr:uncharacterized protein A1O1_06887 [Capronia coronata CBS 617.96]EXJ83268.1 hypothetical protein A1O1_06887 [Capronia coronata CBS 617.96]